MRWIVRLSLVLLGLGWLASEMPLAQTQPHGQPETRRQLGSQWRWTRDGWERPTWLASQARGRQPALHPTVVGILQMLLVVAGLIAFSGRNGRSAVRRQRLVSSAGQLQSPRLGPYRFMEFRRRPRWG